jgi:type II secretory pathway component PulF
MNELGWFVRLWIVVIMFLIVMGLFIGMFSAIGGFVSIVILFSIASCIRAIRLQRAIVVLGYLDQAVRFNLPLTEMLQSAAATERHASGRRLWALSQEMEMGEPIGFALRSVVPEVPIEEVNRIEAAEKAGNIARAIAQSRNRLMQRWSAPGAAVWAYPLLVITIWAVMCYGFATFLLPKYMEIFSDFDLVLPPVVVWVASSEAVPITSVVLVGILIGWAIYFLGTMAYIGCGGRRLPQSWTLFGHDIVRMIPGIGGMRRNRDWASVLSHMGEALDIGLTLEETLRSGVQVALSGSVRRRVNSMLRELESGNNPAEAARRSRWPADVRSILATGRNVSSLSDALAAVAEARRSRADRHEDLFRSIMMPLLLGLAGALVGFTVYIMFSPLPMLIEGTMNWSGP